MIYPNGVEPPREEVLKYSLLVPENIRSAWIDLQSCFKSHREFIKHEGWNVYHKPKNGVKLFTRVSESNRFCIKSVAQCRGNVNQIIKALFSSDYKVLYDDTFEGGHNFFENLPYATMTTYAKFKKVMVVSSRDVIMIAKPFRISDKLIYLLGNSFEVDSYPPVKNVVRAETPFTGWRIKVLEDGPVPLCKIMFYSEADFKISLFLAK